MDPSSQDAPTQECFDENPIMFMEDMLYGAPADKNYPDRAYIAPTNHPLRQNMNTGQSGKFASIEKVTKASTTFKMKLLCLAVVNSLLTSCLHVFQFLLFIQQRNVVYIQVETTRKSYRRFNSDPMALHDGKFMVSTLILA